MGIATEEFSHIEIVGATIQMLLTCINGNLKDASENSEIMQLLNGKAAKENMIHRGMVAPQFLVGTAGGDLHALIARVCRGRLLILMAMHRGN